MIAGLVACVLLVTTVQAFTPATPPSLPPIPGQTSGHTNQPGQTFQTASPPTVPPIPGQTTAKPAVGGTGTVDVFTLNLAGVNKLKISGNGTHNSGTTPGGVTGVTGITGSQGPLSCGSAPTDVIFLLDTSSSEGPANFHKQLDFVKNFTKEMTIGPKNVQIGAVTFATTVQNEFFLNAHSTKASLLAAIQNIQYRSGNTDTGDGLTFIKDNSLKAQNGARANAGKVVVVITDGNSQDHQKTSDRAAQLHKTGAKVIAVGIGSGINDNELTAIASQPSLVFRVASFDALHTIEKALRQKTCTIPVSVCKVQPFDIVFLLDTSTSEGTRNFQKQLDFFKQFVDNFDIGPQSVQIGLVTFASGVYNQFYMNAYTNKAALKAAIGRVRYVGGNTNTGGGMEFIRTRQLTAQNGARSGVAKVVIVMTDGNSQDWPRTNQQADLLHKSAKVIAIGIGDSIKYSELDHISSDRQHLFQVANFNALHTIEQELAHKTCTTTYKTTVISPLG